jgi:hypothetical protein
MKTLDIAITGDADKGAILSEYTLECVRKPAWRRVRPYLTSPERLT